MRLKSINGVISWYVLALSASLILLRMFRLFLFFSFFLIFLWILLLFGWKESLSILKIKHWAVSRFLSGVRSELLQPYLVINVTGLVQFGKNLNYILPPLASYNYFQYSISTKLIYQFLYLINSYLFFRSLENVFEEERNENMKRKSRGVPTT